MILNAILLFFLFIALGVCTDFAVNHIRYIGSILKVRLFVFGIILGFITSLPELVLGINALLVDAPGVSVGNLLGGIIVLLGLILGGSLLFGRTIRTDGRLASIIPIALVILSPIVLGLDGTFSTLDGVILLALYAGVIALLYRLNSKKKDKHLEIVEGRKGAQSIIFALLGIVGIVLLSHWIIEVTLALFEAMNISYLLIGIVVFSIGTNLPEISIAIISFFKKTSELSLSHLLSSAFSNVFVLGFLATLQPIIFQTGPSFALIAIFLVGIVGATVLFYVSDKEMVRYEGALLLAGYVLFFGLSMYLALSTTL